VPEHLPWMYGQPQGFVRLGERWALYFREDCGLRPSESVLDVGCGLGRVGIPLARYLTEGSYSGFDVDARAIEWCVANISPRWPNARFCHADVHHRASNPEGVLDARHFRFPYRDQEFDFAFAISVFTHMLPEDVERYLAEIARVLKAGGRSAITYVLLNPEAERLMESGSTKSVLGQRLKHDHGHYRLADEALPEQLVGYEESFVLDLYAKVGLSVRHPIHYGRWSGRSTDRFMRQDVILATKA
jgi:SAM-dependent methyltransferase